MILFLNQTAKDKERFCTRLASSKYFSPVTADHTYNLAGHYLVQTGHENLSVLRRENSKSPWFPGPCAFVRYLGEADHGMLRQIAQGPVQGPVLSLISRFLGLMTITQFTTPF